MNGLVVFLVMSMDMKVTADVKAKYVSFFVSGIIVQVFAQVIVSHRW